MEILLVNLTNYPLSKERTQLTFPRYPMGLLTLSAYAKSKINDLTIKIIDLNQQFYILTKNHINPKRLGRDAFWGSSISSLVNYKPTLLGLSANFTTTTFNELHDLASFMKEKFPSIKLIIAGGHNLGASYEEILPLADNIGAICFGEGEIPFVELLSSMQNNEHDLYLNTANCWITKTKLNKNQQFVPQHKNIERLDDIPPIDLQDLCSYDEIKRLGFAIGPLDFSTGRGCANNCVFCSLEYLRGGHKIRSHSLERIKSDIMLYHRKYGIHSYVVVNDNFLHDKEMAINVLLFFASHNLRIMLPSLSFMQIDHDVVFALKKAGIGHVAISIETGNPDTLRRIINKPGDLECIKRAVNILRNADIYVMANVMIGLPGETKESIDIGINNLKEIPCNRYLCVVAIPLPGSRLLRICQENSYIKRKGLLCEMGLSEAIIETDGFSIQYITDKRNEMHLRLNFVENYDMRMGNYSSALITCRAYFNDAHSSAFAYYFAAICCEKLSFFSDSINYKRKYNEIVSNSAYWDKWIKFFELPRWF